MPNCCADIQAIISAYLDSELQDADLREFESHRAHCPDCQEMIDDAERSHAALRSHLRATPPLPEGLRGNLFAALDEEDDLRRRGQRRQWMSWSFPAVASTFAAAALALFVWTNLLAPAPSAAPSSQVTRDAVRQHFQDPLFVGSDRRSIGRSAANYLNTPVQAPRFSSPEVRLLGWSPAQLGGTQSAGFIYEVSNRTGRHRVHVNVVALSKLDLSAQEKLILDGGATLWVDSAYGFNTVTYERESVAYVFSSDMHSQELVDLVTKTDIINMLGRP